MGPANQEKPYSKTVIDEFMLAEYATIASAHFDLHGGLRQTFRFYLGLVVVPFTVFAVYKDVHLQLFHLPSVLLLLFCVVPVLGLLMYLTMINNRFDIILYTRAVNGVRAYFAERAIECNQNALFEIGRKLPIDKRKPPYNEGANRAYTWLFTFVGIINSIYVFIVLVNLSGRICVCIVAGLLYAVIHIILYIALSRIRVTCSPGSAQK